MLFIVPLFAHAVTNQADDAFFHADDAIIAETVQRIETQEQVKKSIQPPLTETPKNGTMYVFKSDDRKVLLTNRITADKKPDWNTSEADKFKYVETKNIQYVPEPMPEYSLKRHTIIQVLPYCKTIKNGVCTLAYTKKYVYK